MARSPEPAGPSTVAEAVQLAAALLGAAGIARARFEARLLVAHALGLDTAAVFARPDRRIGPDDGIRLADLVRRRAGREPMAYVLGVREFWSLPFSVSPATLIPRPESEVLVEAALARLPPTPPRILDLGTGSGCLLLALLAERRDAEGVGVDRSVAAVRVAQGNAEALGLADRARFVCGDWAGAIASRFDAIVCNPPYIKEGGFSCLAPEVSRFEPRLALSGGADGFESFRRILPDLGRLLHRSGVALIETGDGQAETVAAIATGHHLQLVEIHKDLAGIGRCVVLEAGDDTAEAKKGLGNQSVPH